ncbi:MAG: methyltransferase [Actinophytocola sp.]|uniref:methyltransferase n=1 Tax=Actinophytocola sp. TaxID=1872138 RepID=UPI003D6A8C83
MTNEQPRPDRILEIANGYWATGILGVAAKYALFTHLEAGADTAGRLAAETGMSERGAQTLLDGLAGLALVEVHDGGYRNTAEASAFLVAGRRADLSGYAKLKFAQMDKLANLPEVFHTGGPVQAMTEVADNPHWEEVVPAIAAQSVPVAVTAAELLGLADAGEVSILDLGGGSAIFSSIWLELNPSARSTQLDWEPINAIARRLLKERHVADRFTSVDGDLHSVDFGTATHDIVVYSHVAHQESAEDNTAIFARARRALKPGGTFVVCDYVVDDDRSGPFFPLLFASEMLLKSRKGGTWRQSDYRSWLAEAGFEDVSFHATPSPATLVFAR